VGRGEIGRGENALMRSWRKGENKPHKTGELEKNILDELSG